MIDDTPEIRLRARELVELLAEPIAQRVVEKFIAAHIETCPWRQLPFWRIVLVAGVVAGSTGTATALFFG